MGGTVRKTEPVLLAQGEKLLGRFSMTERIARGGSSVVYAGNDDKLARPVCIKVFDHSERDPQIRQFVYESFVQEAQALSMLSHPNTLRIYDFGYLPAVGDEPATPFQISEFLSGGTLSQRLAATGPMGASAVVALVRGLAGALAEAHGVGLVHRDVKPSNVLFAGQTPYIAKLADFGIASLLAPGLPGEPRPHQPLGAYSMNWSAPEQFVGGPVDPSSDVYALALLAVFALTRRVAMAAPSRNEALAVRLDPHAAISRACEGFEVAQDAIELLARTCSYNIDGRPKSALDFAARLAIELGADAVEAQPLQLRAQMTDQLVAGRCLKLVPETVDVSCPGGGRLRASTLHFGERRWLQLRGLDCFLSLDDGPPTNAVQIEGAGSVAVIDPTRGVVARVEGSVAEVQGMRTMVRIGGRRFEVAETAGMRPLAALDLGRGRECFLLSEVQESVSL